MLTPKQLLIINRARRHGIVNPVIAFMEAKRAGLEFAVLCAVLMKETSGGHNVFGHDGNGAPCAGWGTVTKAKYLRYVTAYRACKVAQGVGPMQLTFRGYQLRADALGGCYKVTPNIRVGCGILRSNISHAIGTSYDGKVWAGLRAYNGSAAYANSVYKGVQFWRSIL